MAGRAVRELTVINKQQLTPNMMRITLGGDALADFPENQESGYIKLSFASTSSPSGLVKRSYTIRAFDAKKRELSLDFVSHGDNGPASAWALTSNVGDPIMTDGPGAVKLARMSADWFFIAGDMTALPAICVNLEKLPRNAKGYAVIEILTEEDKQNIDAPKNIKIHWVINSQPDKPNTDLIDKVKQLDWMDGMVDVWVASEFDAMRHLRRYFKQERSVDRSQVYASSYWKMGDTDEGNKAAKKMDTEEA